MKITATALRKGFCRCAVDAGNGVISFFHDAASVCRFTGEFCFALRELIRNPRSLRKRETLYYLEVCGPDALPITLLICLLMGLILAYQTAVQMHKYGADAFLPALVGCSIVRELGPLMTAVIATGRMGSSFAAELASMKSTEEIAAMQTMGLSIWRFLILPKMIAMVCMMPLLTLAGNFAGIFGGMLVGVLELNIPVETYYLSTVRWVPMRFFVESLSKSIVFAFIITTVSCIRGFESKGDALAVGRATTASVVTGIVSIILADTFLAKLFNAIFYGI